jgi:HEPN domain-containing protein
MPADPSDPHAWMQRAYSNLRLAEKGQGKDIMLEDLCFNAQQAVEKALKAICLCKGHEFPKTHSITRLIDIVESAGVEIPEQIKLADFLTQYAVETRYPAPVEEITFEEYQQSLVIAARVVFWAETIISEKE